MNFARNIFKKKWVKFGIIPLFLLGVWSALTLFYIVVLDESFLVVSYSHSKKDFSSFTLSKLYAGDKISGSFTGRASNMGILGIRIKSYSRVPYREEDKLVFRIKEKGSDEWFYENIYRSGLMYEFSLFPFGFPVISDSKGRIYQFELESLEGNKENAVSLQNREPIFVSKYQESKEYLTQNPIKIPFFVLKKAGNYITNIDVQFSAFVYLLPLIFYLLIISKLGTKLFRLIVGIYAPFQKYEEKADYYVFSGITSAVIVLDILYLQVPNGVIYLVVGIIMYIISRLYGVKSKNALAVSIVLLLLSVPLYYLDYFHVAERSASWAYIFLVLSTIQMLGERNKKIDIKLKKGKS